MKIGLAGMTDSHLATLMVAFPEMAHLCWEMRSTQWFREPFARFANPGDLPVN